MGYTVEKHQFVSFSSEGSVTSDMGMAQTLMNDLIQTGGMKLVYPSNGTISSSTAVAVLESTPEMDPLADQGQKWRLRIEAGAASTTKYIRINIGTEFQIPSDGSAVTKSGENETSGHLSGRYTDRFGAGDSTQPPFISQDFFYSDNYAEIGASPMSYRLSVSDHGVAFCCWRNAYDFAGNMFAWFVAQRPVDPADGSVLADHYSPVFVVYSTGGGGVTERLRIGGTYYEIAQPDGIKKFVARESDVFAPTPSVPASVAVEDSNPIINPTKQVSISVDNKYMITFPSGLNTQRRAYKHELDMIAYTSADVIAQDSDVNVTVFGEDTPRTYKAMQANGEYNTGMRILLLTQGAGIPAPTP